MRHVLVWVALVLAAPIPGRAQPAPPAAAGTAVTEARDYVAAAAAGDLFERTAGALVLRHDGAPEGVQRFAQKMITDHHNMTVMLRRVAEGAGVRPGVPAMRQVQQAMIEQLQAATGAERARIYLIQQEEAHRQALLLHRGYANVGDVQALREHARMAAQIVEGHIMELGRLQGGR
jgi:putative membrane protein